MPKVLACGFQNLEMRSQSALLSFRDDTGLSLLLVVARGSRQTAPGRSGQSYPPPGTWRKNANFKNREKVKPFWVATGRVHPHHPSGQAAPHRPTGLATPRPFRHSDPAPTPTRCQGGGGARDRAGPVLGAWAARERRAVA
jgi:hypothetical protein